MGEFLDGDSIGSGLLISSLVYRFVVMVDTSKFSGSNQLLRIKLSAWFQLLVVVGDDLGSLVTCASRGEGC